MDDHERGWPPGSFLGGLSNELIATLSSRWRTERHDKGELILSEHANIGDDGGDFLILLQGHARAAAFTENGREVTFTDIGEGDCFGEISAIDKQPRSASVVAQSDVKVARIPSAVFDRLLGEEHEILSALLRLAAAKLRALVSKIVDQTGLTASQRIRRELLCLARINRTGPDKAVIASPPTQYELATRAHCRREAVNREMKLLESDGLTRRVSGTIVVNSIRRLEASLMPA